MGRERYPDMKELTITADCGGSNGARVRLWKIELQKLKEDFGMKQTEGEWITAWNLADERTKDGRPIRE